MEVVYTRDKYQHNPTMETTMDDFNEEDMFSPQAIETRPAPILPKSTNPLAGYFRVPGLHVELPTRGAFLPKGTYNPTMAGDVQVYPMRASDELLLRSADALMSGYALEEMIKSCVPAIGDPRKLSTPDLDVVLIAIRAATHGDVMEVDVPCPECGHQNSFDCHIPTLMKTMTYVEPHNEVRLSPDVVVNVQPYNLECVTKISLGTYEETRKIQGIEEDNPERTKMINESYSKMSKLNLDAISMSIISIAIPNATVTNPKDIREFIAQTSQAWVKKIENKLSELNALGVDKKMFVACTKCSHEWQTEIEFDPASFFDSGS